MKTMFRVLRTMIRIITLIVFAAGVILLLLGAYDFVRICIDTLRSGEEHFVTPLAIGMLKVVDLLVVSIVLFVFALGILILFNDQKEDALPLNLPEWLKVKNFMQLKVILWETILTTMLISFLANIAEKRLHGDEVTKQDLLLLPGSIVLIALGLFLLRKGEEHKPPD